MKIYFSHKRTEDDSQLYKDLSRLNHEFIFPHLNSQDAYNSKELFQNKGCDLVLAEVSNPSTGQGIELGWASILEVQIVCIYKAGSNISTSLKQVSKKFIEYSGFEDLKAKLQNELK